MEILALTIFEACKRANAGKTTLYKAIQNMELRAVKRGARTLILPEDLREYVHSWPQLKPAKTDDPSNVQMPAKPARAAREAHNRSRAGSRQKETTASLTLSGTSST